MIPLPEIEGVPEELIRALNARFRDLPRQNTVATAPAGPTTLAGAIVGAGQNLVGTHAQRLILDPATVDIGTTFEEMDRTSFYQVQEVASLHVWVWIGGEMRGTIFPDERPTDLTANDTGFLFFLTDYTLHYRWTGTNWGDVPYGKLSPFTHAARVGWVPWAGQIFYETDRTVFYRGTWATPSVWKYGGGVMRDTLANIPADLGADDAGFRFEDQTYGHTFIWAGAAWEFAKGEILPGTFAFGEDAPGPVGWHLCDGATVTRCKRDGTAATESVTLPNAAGCVVEHGVYSATPAAAVAPALTGNTGDESAHTHGVTTNVTVGNHATAAITTAAGATSVLTAPAAHSVANNGVTSDVGAAHHHTAGSLAVDATGKQKRLVAALYMRL